MKFFVCGKLINGLEQQIAMAELDMFCEAGFSYENLEKLKNSVFYKSALYFDALKSIH